MTVDRGGDVFIVGPVRSGTSWLQTVLAEHPTLASPAETHMFVHYFGPLLEAWGHDQELLRDALAERGNRVALGLATVVTDGEFIEMLRAFYSSVRDLVVSAKPGATRLLEKTPDHAHWLDTIKRVVPDAAIVFIVRDPRDTVRSVLQASGEDWGGWAPTSVHDATSLWLTSVRPYFAHKNDPNVLLVRYEDLRSDTTEFDGVAKFLGLEPHSTWLENPIDLAPQDRTSTIVRGEAAEADLQPYATQGFSYHNRQHRRELTPYESAYVATRCRDEMRALGYETETGALPVRLRIEMAPRAIRYKARQLRRRFKARVPQRPNAESEAGRGA